MLPVGYKVLAALIHKRLIFCGVDSKISGSQYGFRPRRGCSDALMIIRRMIDAACESKRECLMLVFLDWAKAFDRIETESLLHALRRFGFPEKLVQIIGAIYAGRKFFIHDHAGNSKFFDQNAGIAQGCPFITFFVYYRANSYVP